MKNLICKIAGFALAAVLTSALCIFLYCCNNKYTNQSVQASQGILTLSQTDLEKPVFLIKDWAFYPERLLSSDDFSDGAPEQYLFYTSIGDSTQFLNAGNPDDPHGCGTYAMHLSLPDTPAVYALDLPEIFSAYRLYVNGSLLLQMGNPDPASYVSRTQNRTVTFEASDRVTILLAVSDYSHFYSGMAYPPAFGLPEVLSVVRTVRYTIATAVVTFGLLIAALSLYFGVRMKDKNAFVFFLLCLSMCLFCAYPIVHTIFALSVFPSYAVELVSGYLLAFLTVLLHNRLCRSDLRLRFLSCTTAALFCAVSFFYGLCSAHLTTGLIRLFSSCVFVYKAALALYLLLTSWFLFERKASAGRPLFYASLSYGVFFLWDRILPDYEPIFGGWFSEWGSLILVIAIGYLLWRDMVSAYFYGLVFAEEHHQMLRQLSIQSSYMQKLSAQIGKNRKIVHDFRQHLYTISSLAEKLSKTEDRESVWRKLSGYLQELSSQQLSAPSSSQLSFSKNIAVDALLYHYYTAATEHFICASFQITLPDTLALSDVEICTVLGNLLENALHACCYDTASERRICISSRETKSQFFLCIENTYDGKIKKQGSQFLSLHSPSARLGIGLESVREIIERHGGTMNIYPMEHLFRVGIVLPHQTDQTDSSNAG